MRDTVAVLRANGERTAALAEQKLRSQFERVHVLHVKPFSQAVRECFRLAIAEQARWLVTCDADVLVSEDCAKEAQAMARMIGERYWQAIGHVDDKLAGGLRLGGIRVYRVAELPAMLPLVSDKVIRPEADLCVRNPAWLRVLNNCGTHDYEQWLRDLHRKGAAHRVKHESWAGRIVPRWRASKDPDLQAALAGWEGRPLEIEEKAPL